MPPLREALIGQLLVQVPASYERLLDAGLGERVEDVPDVASVDVAFASVDYDHGGSGRRSPVVLIG